MFLWLLKECAEDSFYTDKYKRNRWSINLTTMMISQLYLIDTDLGSWQI